MYCQPASNNVWAIKKPLGQSCLANLLEQTQYKQSWNKSEQQTNPWCISVLSDVNLNWHSLQDLMLWCLILNDPPTPYLTKFKFKTLFFQANLVLSLVPLFPILLFHYFVLPFPPFFPVFISGGVNSANAHQEFLSANRSPSTEQPGQTLSVKALIYHRAPHGSGPSQALAMGGVR